ncbi:hypothetical protein [Pseudomonas japonica]|uniref:PD-(D/E)XK nuclease superfamily protein n=1 Tax=Pseudomonas japonica TaxID=256466 RepID=A0A239L9P3_9PSED|nr:hypothetical protein [Pseudomonas japonica]SNT27171.1 hypothetical protein SAMN05444352_13353 [Pseudomonas japonica]
MLHAITHNKSRVYQRYLGHREPGEKRASEEDEITALVMGPLAFLPASAIGAFWMALTKQGRPEAFPEGPVSHAEMRFWPRKNRTEPDMLVELWWGAEKWSLLIEFKWRAPLSGDDQLHKQWKNFLSQDEQKQALHIFIAPEVSAGIEAKDRDDIWKDHLLLRSWYDILNTLHGLKNSELLLHRWSEQVICFLEKLGVRPFCGFKKLGALELAPQRTEIFWKGFDGFVDLKVPEAPSVNAVQQIFFHAAGGRHG